LTVYDATSVENQWVIDGVNTTNVIKGFQGKAINNEFVQEVQVKTGGYQAEYGGALGGIVNVITKSGGDQFHGEGFVYYDSGAMHAKPVVRGNENFFGMKFTSGDHWDYGADLGGYLWKERLWFFGAYNRVDTHFEASRYFGNDEVPDTMQFPRDEKENLYSGKLTWKINERSMLVGTVFSDPSVIDGAAFVDTFGGEIVSPDPATWAARRNVGGTDYGLRYGQLFGSWGVLAIQASRHEDEFVVVPLAAQEARFEDLTCEGGTPEAACTPPDGPNFVSGGLGLYGGGSQHNASSRNQIRADVTVNTGGHEIMLGGGVEKGRTTVANVITGGQIVSLKNEYGQDYYEHYFFARSVDDPPAEQVLKASVRNDSLYVRDRWMLSANLAVSAGVRWEQLDVRNVHDETVLKTRPEWQPRIGVAWDPWGRGQAKVTAFWGRFYYSLPTDLAFSSIGPLAEVKTYNFDPVDRTQDPNVFGHESPDVTFSVTKPPADSGIGGSFEDELTLGVEKAIDPTLSVAVKGTYRRLGRAIENRCDLNPEAEGNNGSSCAFMNPGSDGMYASGDFHSCNGLDGDAAACPGPTEASPPARRYYRGIEILARKATDRFWFQASYSYSSVRGNYDGGVFEIFTPIGQTDPGMTAAFDFPQFWHNAYGRLYLDRPHHARLDASYVMPFGLAVGLGAFVSSGKPLNRKGYFSDDYGGTPIQLVPRGYEGRLPIVWEANLTLSYPFRVGLATVTLQGYVDQLFNNQITLQTIEGYARGPRPGYPDSMFDPGPQLNPNYGHVTERQAPRAFRAAVRVSF
jgi:hypothetical protein